MIRIVLLAVVAAALGVAGVVLVREAHLQRDTPAAKVATMALPPEETPPPVAARPVEIPPVVPAPAPAPVPAAPAATPAPAAVPAPAVAPTPARAPAPQAAAPGAAFPGGGLLQPIDCRLGDTCWILNYFDIDSGPATRDFHLHQRSYNGHDGVDIAIRDMVEMARGVAVLAAAPGAVRGQRDGETDGLYIDKGPAATADKHCGNGVLIDHGGGWTTQYCHMRRGSVTVKVGDRVTAGQKLGLVGMSGDTEYPHVHLTLRKDNVQLDPFTGNPAGACCTALPPGHSLWANSAGIAYQEHDLFAVGFTTKDALPIDAIRRDARGEAAINRNAAAVSFFAAVFGSDAGDKLRLQVFLPDGAPLADGSREFDKPLVLNIPARVMRRPQDQLWPVGRYRGVATLERTLDGRVVRQTKESTVDIR